MGKSLSDERIDTNIYENCYEHGHIVVCYNHKTKQIRYHKRN